MHNDRLRIYLDDHLALFTGEIGLAERCRSENKDRPIADFLARLVGDLEAQRTLARDVLKRLGGTEGKLKQGAAWFAEKLGRLKVNDTLASYSPLSRVLELEALAAAAEERAGLWDSLDAIAVDDARLAGIDFASHRDRSQDHVFELRAKRREAAVLAFAAEKS